jgi:cysteinyl-tRNA synthetase
MYSENGANWRFTVSMKDLNQTDVRGCTVVNQTSTCERMYCCGVTVLEKFHPHLK